MKKIISLAIIIIAVAIAYYFVKFLPSQKLAQTEQTKQEFLFDKQTECMKICQVHYENDKKDLSDGSVLGPEYSYNANKNACFYSGGWFDYKSKTMIKNVINCQTNEDVLTFMETDNKVITIACPTCVNSIEEYNLRLKEFMAN